ncbi:MAG: YihY/virulence factor BrkB family protein [Anaerolineae bacterium]|jgi:membrane protein
MDPDSAWSLLKETFSEWQQDKASRLAAALSYYTIFSLPPLLLIAVAVAGFFLGRQAVRQELIAQISSIVGDAGAQAIGVMLDGAGWDTGASTLATIVGVATLLFGATGAFAQLQEALDTVWDVAPKPDIGPWGMVRSRLLSFSMILVVAFLLLIALALSTALSAAGTYLETLLPGLVVLARILNLVLSFAVITLLFAAIYKVLPDVEIDWSDVWIGAAATAVLFTVGKYLLSLYLARTSASSAYGAAGALILILLWIYYSAQILFLGAEFTQVYARRYGSRILPAEYAIRVTAAAQAHEGIPREEVMQAEQAPTIAPNGTAPAAPAMPPPAEKVERSRRLPYVLGVLGFSTGLILGALYQATRAEDTSDRDPVGGAHDSHT